MKEYQKRYQITIKTVGPIFVGSGKEIGKKEYIFLGRKQVGILDIEKVYMAMKRLGKEKAFETYLLNSKDDMGTWLKKENISLEKIKPHIKYILDCSDANIESKKQLHIMEMMKDAYGRPYIPGSSLKGMLRTILLSHDIVNNENKHLNERENLVQELFKRENRINRTSLLKGNINNIEANTFRTINRESTNKEDAVNDILQGMVVSDSNPLEIKDLILGQKVELHTDGRETVLPILRECIKPGTEIKFSLTIDSSVCPVDDVMLKEAVKNFITIYYSRFSRFFPGLEKAKANQVLLGGGSGFVSKTIVYSMFNKQNGIKVSKMIFQKTNVPKEHKHHLDESYGVSPHIMKCTRYQGKLLQMGLATIRIDTI